MERGFHIGKREPTIPQCPGPVFDGNRVSIYMEVEGLGDFLPKYAGNLDIMTAAGLRTAEMYAEEIIAGRFVPTAVKS